MIEISLDAEPRDGAGKGVTRKLRAKNRVPAVLYGFGLEKAENLTVDPKAIAKTLRTAWGRNVLLTLNVPGKSLKVMCREVQLHPVSREVRHVDFVSPNPAKDVIVWVPLNVTGRSVGVQAGGKVRQPYKEVRIKTRPALIPSEIPIDVTNLDVGDSIMASQVNLGAGVTIVCDRDFAVVQVITPKGPAATDEKK